VRNDVPRVALSSFPPAGKLAVVPLSLLPNVIPSTCTCLAHIYFFANNFLVAPLVPGITTGGAAGTPQRDLLMLHLGNSVQLQGKGGFALVETDAQEHEPQQQAEEQVPAPVP